MSTRHIRESVTPVGSTTEGPGGMLLADCSCGATYSVPQSHYEGAALEAAHEVHVAEALAIESLERLAKRWPRSLSLLSIDGGLVVVHTADRDAIAERTVWDDSYVLAAIDGIPNDGGGS